MSNVFEYCEFVGISTVSVEDAISQAVLSVSQTKKSGWFEVLSTRGRIVDQSGKLEFQVTVRFGCRV